MGMSDNDIKVYDALKKLERGLKTMEPANVLLVGDIMMVAIFMALQII